MLERANREDSTAACRDKITITKGCVTEATELRRIMAWVRPATLE